jgi:serine protease Do
MKRILASTGARVTALILGGAVLISAVAVAQRPKSETFEAPAVDTRPIDRSPGSQNSFSPVVKRVGPAVVQVFTTGRSRPAQFSGPPGMEEFFRHFFGGRMPQTPERVLRGIGSGVITTQDGYILTNNHVVEGADEVKVALQDGREFDAKVVGRDPKTDVAVLKVDAKDLPAITIADSDLVEVGDLVLAVGNPFGIGQTVTTGIVSAMGRSGATGIDYEDFIQTDAAINPGNSGGALVDSEGRLIGINTAILSRSGGHQGIGFAIPSNLARDVMESIVQSGKVTRGFLGVAIQDINPALAKEFNMKDTRGVLVSDVTPNTPAAKAGLKSGDVITEFNGRAVSDSRRLRLEVARTQPGKTVPLKFIRNGAQKTLQVTVREIPGTGQVAAAERETDGDTLVLQGVAVSDLEPRLRRQFNLPANLRGAIISEVQPGSAAAQAGLRAGDVILEINRKPVANADQAIELTQNTGRKQTLLRIWRDGSSRYVIVDESRAG